jgi:hypothetical protein
MDEQSTNGSPLEWAEKHCPLPGFRDVNHKAGLFRVHHVCIPKEQLASVISYNMEQIACTSISFLVSIENRPESEEQVDDYTQDLLTATCRPYENLRIAQA